VHKKRLIFTLLYNDGYFILSRNFRQQRVGNTDWLQKNYNFSKIATAIDELIILNVSNSMSILDEFYFAVQEIAKECFVPLALGGGIRSVEHAASLFDNGADKIVVNTLLEKGPDLVSELVEICGSQCVIGAIDYKQVNDSFLVAVEGGGTVATGPH